MGKQQTLGKFWQLPPTYPPDPKQPLEQAKLDTFLLPKPSTSGASQELQVEGKREEDEEVEVFEPVAGPSRIKIPVEVAQEQEEEEEEEGIIMSSTKAGSPTKPTPNATPVSDGSNGKGKKRVVADSSDEENDDVVVAGSSSKGKEAAKDVKEVVKEKDMDSKVIKKPKLASPTKSKSKPSSSSKPAASNPFASMAAAKASKDVKSIKKPKLDPDDEDVDMDSPVKEDEGAGEGEGEDEEDEEERELGGAKEVASKLVASFSAHKLITTTWAPGKPVPYSALTDTFTLIDSTTKRLQISSYLTQFLLEVAKNPGEGGGDLLKVVYLCINRLCPDYMGLELGIGETLIIKAIAQSTGRTPTSIKADLRKVGDLGLVAEQSRGKQKTLFKAKELTVPFVFKCLQEIANASGNQSQAKKIGIVCKLLTPCNGTETRFIIRSLEGKLRIGLAEKTLVTALGHAMVLKEVGNKKLSQGELAERLARGAEIVKAVYSELPNYDLIVPALLKGGIDNLRDVCKLTPGVPLKPMLAKPTKAIGEVLNRFEGKEFTCEYKYDGERAQVHLLEDGQIVVFSRNSENMSTKYPDLIESIPKCIKPSVRSFVIDSEAVAFDLATKKLLPFQDLARRKRKDVRTEDITVRVHLFAFDLLYLNGESLLTKELHERRALLREHFHPVEGEFGFAVSSDGSTTEQIAEFLDESIKDGCEGLMVKRLTSDDSTYEPSRRSINWLKLKKDYLDGVGDSCDLVVVGAYYGKGKRTNVYGAFLLACYDPDSENFQTACKIGTGFSEVMLQELYDKLSPLELTSGKRRDIQADASKPPDVWFEPKVVFEVLTADLTLSPIYMAGQGIVDARGISLRFPRFIKIRDDKDADDATTSEQIAEFYENQATAHTKGGGGGDDY